MNTASAAYDVYIPAKTFQATLLTIAVGWILKENHPHVPHQRETVSSSVSVKNIGHGTCFFLLTELPDKIWEETTLHANWLRNILPERRKDGYIPILRWDPKIIIELSSLLYFGQPGYAFIYRSRMTSENKIIHTSEYDRFLTVERDTWIVRVFVQNGNILRI